MAVTIRFRVVCLRASRNHSTVTNHPGSRIEPTLPVFRQDEFSFLRHSEQNKSRATSLRDRVRALLCIIARRATLMKVRSKTCECERRLRGKGTGQREQEAEDISAPSCGARGGPRRHQDIKKTAYTTAFHARSSSSSSLRFSMVLATFPDELTTTPQ